MRLDFKRFLSGVLALVMMTSALTVVNVSSVFAAETSPASYANDDGSFYLTVEEFFTSENLKVALGSAKAPTIQDTAKKALPDLAFSSNWKTTDMSSGVTSVEGHEFSYGILCTSNGRTITFTPKKEGTITVYSYRPSGNNGYTIGTPDMENPKSVTFSTNNKVQTDTLHVGAAEDGTIQKVTIAPQSNTVFCALEFKPDSEEEASTTYKWKVDSSKVTYDKDTDGFEPEKLVLTDPDRTEPNNGLKYDGNEFMVNPAYNYWDIHSDNITTSKGETETTITINVTNDMLLPCSEVTFKIKNASVESTIADARILRLQCTDAGHNHALIPIKMTNTGGDYETAASIMEYDPVQDKYIDVPLTQDSEYPSQGNVVWLSDKCNYKLTMIGGRLVEEGTAENDTPTYKEEFQNSDGKTDYTAEFVPDARIKASEATGDTDLFYGLETMGETEDIYPQAVISKANVFTVWARPGAAHTVTMVRDDSEVDAGNISALSLRTNSESIDSGLVFEVSGKAKASFTYKSAEEGKTAAIGIAKSESGSPDGVNLLAGNADATNTSPTVAKTVSIDLEEGTYIVYNAGGTAAETVSPVRLTAASFGKADNAEPAPSVGGKAYVWFANIEDHEYNPTLSEYNDETVFSGLTKNGSSYIVSSKEVQKFNIGGTYYNVKRRSSDSTQNFTVNVPAGVTDATLYVVAAGGSGRTLDIKQGDSSKGSIPFSTSSYDVGSVDGLSAGTYTATSTSNLKVALVVLVTGSAEPPKASITGTVTLTKKYEYVSHKDYNPKTYGTVCDGKDENTYVPNVTFDTNSIDEKITTLEVQVTPPDGQPVPKVTTTPGSGTYQIGDGETALADGDYKITVIANGVKSTEQTVTISDSKSKEVEPIELTRPQVTVRFVTNIKNFEVSSSSAKSLKVYEGETPLFSLDETTYYNGLNKDATKDVNSSASTTHIVKMPAGNYKYEYSDTSGTYKLSQTNNASDNNMNFEITSGGVQRIYFLPQTDKLDQNVKDEISSAQGDISGAVESGLYTFDFDSLGADSADKAKVKFSENPEQDGAIVGDEKGMVAYGLKTHQTSSGHEKDPDYFGINDKNGAVVFTLDKPMLANITIEMKACVLYNVDPSKTKSINGNQSVIPLDISFSKRTVSLEAGTYVLASLTDGSSGKTAAKVTSIQFIGGSPFKVIAKNGGGVEDYDADGTTGKLIIGQYDSSNDDLIGTTTAESYSKFAIIIANKPDVLTVANINNIAGNSVYDKAKIETINKTESTDGEKPYTPSVTKLKFGADSESSNIILIDETDSIFGKIVAGEKTIEDTENGVYKYYATILSGLDRGTYYVAGAAKLEEPSDTSNSDAWLIQDEPVVSFTVE